jgi:hypothetical protein
MNVHELIDQFVAHLGSPERNFQRIDNAPWIVDLEAKLPKLLPASFRSLLARYSFSAFDAGALSFFANLGDGSDQDLGVAIFKDGIIADSTLKSGYIQFARPVSGSYDPVCFDANHSPKNREFPIVRLDHEEILSRDRILVSENIADSFIRYATDIAGRA